MPDIFDLLTAGEIGTYYTQLGSNKVPFLGATLFPAQKQAGLDLSWIRGSQGLPVALKPAAFDAKAPIRDRIGVAKIETEMPLFRETMRIGEKDRQELNKLKAASNQAIMQPIINKIYSDAANLVGGADVTSERMRMQLLSSGLITIEAEGLRYAYDYKFKADHKKTLTGAAKWSDTDNSTPIDDITAWMDQVEDDTGNRPTRAICTRKTWGYLLKNKSIRLDMNPVGGQNIILTDNTLKAYFQEKLGLQVAVYTKKYALEVGGVSQQFYPDNYFTLIPDGVMGNTHYGTTPEESDLMAGNTDAQVSIVNTGVAITTYKEPHPVNNITVVSAIVLPSFEQIDSTFIAKVA